MAGAANAQGLGLRRRVAPAAVGVLTGQCPCHRLLEDLGRHVQPGLAGPAQSGHRQLCVDHVRPVGVDVGVRVAPAESPSPGVGLLIDQPVNILLSRCGVIQSGGQQNVPRSPGDG